MTIYNVLFTQSKNTNTPYFDYVKAAYRLNCDKFLFLFFELYKCDCLIVRFVSFFQMAILRKEDDSNHEDDP